MSTANTVKPGATVLHWPSGEPSWQQSILKKLAQTGNLHGIPPQVLAAISYYTSKYGATGLAVNSAGHGGYFGEGSSTQGAGPFTTAQLTTAGAASFTTQAKYAAQILAGYGHTLAGDLNTYASGNPTQSSAFTKYIEDTVSGGNPSTLAVTIWGILTGPGAAIDTYTTATGGTGNAAGGIFGSLGNISKFFANLDLWITNGFTLGWSSIFSILLGIGLIGIGAALLGLNVLNPASIVKGLI